MERRHPNDFPNSVPLIIRLDGAASPLEAPGPLVHHHGPAHHAVRPVQGEIAVLKVDQPERVLAVQRAVLAADVPSLVLVVGSDARRRTQGDVHIEWVEVALDGVTCAGEFAVDGDPYLKRRGGISVIYGLTFTGPSAS